MNSICLFVLITSNLALLGAQELCKVSLVKNDKIETNLAKLFHINAKNCPLILEYNIRFLGVSANSSINQLRWFRTYDYGNYLLLLKTQFYNNFLKEFIDFSHEIINIELSVEPEYCLEFITSFEKEYMVDDLLLSDFSLRENDQFKSLKFSSNFQICKTEKEITDRWFDWQTVSCCTFNIFHEVDCNWKKVDEHIVTLRVFIALITFVCVSILLSWLRKGNRVMEFSIDKCKFIKERENQLVPKGNPLKPIPHLFFSYLYYKIFQCKETTKTQSNNTEPTETDKLIQPVQGPTQLTEGNSVTVPVSEDQQERSSTGIITLLFSKIFQCKETTKTQSNNKEPNETDILIPSGQGESHSTEKYSIKKHISMMRKYCPFKERLKDVITFILLGLPGLKMFFYYQQFQDSIYVLACVSLILYIIVLLFPLIFKEYYFSFYRHDFESLSFFIKEIRKTNCCAGCCGIFCKALFFSVLRGAITFNIYVVLFSSLALIIRVIIVYTVLIYIKDSVMINYSSLAITILLYVWDSKLDIEQVFARFLKNLDILMKGMIQEKKIACSYTLPGNDKGRLLLYTFNETEKAPKTDKDELSHNNQIIIFCDNEGQQWMSKEFFFACFSMKCAFSTKCNLNLFKRAKYLSFIVLYVSVVHYIVFVYDDEHDIRNFIGNIMAILLPKLLKLWNQSHQNDSAIDLDKECVESKFKEVVENFEPARHLYEEEEVQVT